MTGKQDEIFHLISNQRNAKKKKERKQERKRSACILSLVDHSHVSRLKGRHPTPSPWQRITIGTAFQESNLVIGLKSPTALFAAIYPKAKIGSNLNLQ